MDSDIKNEFPVGKYVSYRGKNAENFFFLEFFCLYNFLIWSFNRNFVLEKRNFNSDVLH